MELDRRGPHGSIRKPWASRLCRWDLAAIMVAKSRWTNGSWVIYIFELQIGDAIDILSLNGMKYPIHIFASTFSTVWDLKRKTKFDKKRPCRRVLDSSVFWIPGSLHSVSVINSFFRFCLTRFPKFVNCALFQDKSKPRIGNLSYRKGRKCQNLRSYWKKQEKKEKA